MQLQRPSLIQSQRFALNPQLYQSLKLMGLPIVDLREKIEEELERNPALEVLEDRSTVSLEDSVKPPKEESEENEYFENSSDSGFVSRGGDEEADEQRRFLEGALTHSETLQEHLLWQLQLEPIDEELKRICELLIQNLDEDGFHKEPVETLFKGHDLLRIKEAMKIVQGLDPVGACTADYHESLLVQINVLPEVPKGMVEALSHLELLERGKFAEAAKRIGCTEEEAEQIFNLIKELSPFPGRKFGVGETRFVLPDIQVVQKEGEFKIILNNEEIPVLGLSPFFMKIAGVDQEAGAASTIGTPANAKKKDKPSRDFARETIREARWFINAINQRNHTLLKVTRAIVEFQRAFFINGPKYLTPLTLRDIAQEIGVHETTVSRTANGKYMQTEWGVYEIRHFFSNSIRGTGSAGSNFSKEGVKEVIKEIIQGEVTRHEALRDEASRHLSDQDIVKVLASRGITLARRTVAKYRHELDLGPSFSR